MLGKSVGRAKTHGIYLEAMGEPRHMGVNRGWYRQACILERISLSAAQRMH